VGVGVGDGVGLGLSGGVVAAELSEVVALVDETDESPAVPPVQPVSRTTPHSVVVKISFFTIPPIDSYAL
jgi:hypothetical protein